MAFWSYAGAARRRFYHSRAEALRKINITTDLNFMWQWKVENMVMLLGYIQKCQKSYVCCWGMGSLLPSTEVGRGSLSQHCVSRGLSPGSLSPQFLSSVPNFEFFSPVPVPAGLPGPRFSKLVSRTGPRFYELVPVFRIFCPHPCPRTVPDNL